MESLSSQRDAKRTAEMWALADDENFQHLLVWRRVKARAEAGGFNGVLAHDYAQARKALEALTAMLPRDRIDA